MEVDVTPVPVDTFFNFVFHGKRPIEVWQLKEISPQTISELTTLSSTEGSTGLFPDVFS